MVQVMPSDIKTLRGSMLIKPTNAFVCPQYVSSPRRHLISVELIALIMFPTALIRDDYTCNTCYDFTTTLIRLMTRFVAI